MSADAGPVQARRPRWLSPALAATAAVALLLSPFWAPPLMRHLAFFRVRHVEVVGARFIQPNEIIERLHVDTQASVWDPKRRFEARVSAHPLVRDVEVSRKLPGTLVVRVVEHTPVALVPTVSGFRAYDERGVQLPIDPAFADVDAPILARPDGPILRLLGAARTTAPELFNRVSEMRRDGAGDLVIVLDSLPVRALATVTLQQLADLELVESDLARRRLRATELDLRFRDQVIARLQ